MALIDEPMAPFSRASSTSITFRMFPSIDSTIDLSIDHAATTIADVDLEDSAAPDRSQRGASLVEYALLVALIALVCIAAVTLLGGATAGQFSSIADGLD